MKKTVMLAKKFGTQIGAHPGLPDLQGFGRREMQLTPDEVYDIIVYQTGALKAFTEAAGLKLHHVKPHGSLYGIAHKSEDIAYAVCKAVKDIDPSLYIYIMKKGVIGEIAESIGLRAVYELYSDLSYDNGGNLVITRAHDAHNPKQAAERVKKMLIEKKVTTADGTEVSIEGNSVCVHSDTPGAVNIIKAIRKILEKEGCSFTAP